MEDTKQPTEQLAEGVMTQSGEVKSEKNLDLNGISKLAEEKAQAKAEAVFKSMLEQSGLNKEVIGKMVEEWKANEANKQTSIIAERDDYKTKYETLVKQNEINEKSKLIEQELINAGANKKLIKLFLNKINFENVAVVDGKVKDSENLLKPIIEEYKDFFGEITKVGAEPKNINGNANYESDPFLKGFVGDKNKK